MAVFTGLGSAASPSITFSADTNTGIFSPGADQVAISTNGTGRLFVDDTGLIGIGAAPLSGHQLTVNGSNLARICLQTTALGQTTTDGFALEIDSSGTYFTNRENTPSIFYTNNTARMYITSAGLVGIGTASPGSALEINAAAATSPFIAKINTAEAARIDSSGRLLVGTSTSYSGPILQCNGAIGLGVQNAATASLRPHPADGTDIAGSELILGGGAPTGNGSAGGVRIVPSVASATSGAVVRGLGTRGIYVRHQITNWDDNPGLYGLNVSMGGGASNYSGLTAGSNSILTIDAGASGTGVLELTAVNNLSNGRQGFIRFFGGSNKNPYATITVTHPGNDRTSGNLQIDTYNAGVEGTVATFTNTGRVGIGTTGPTFLLELPNVASDAGGRGRSNQWATYSDGRIKTDREELPYGIDAVMQLEPLRYFHHNSTINEDGDVEILEEGEVSIGLVAQDVDNIIPEIVSVPEDLTKDLCSLDYAKLNAVLVKAIQEQQGMITDLQAKVTALEAS